MLRAPDYTHEKVKGQEKARTDGSKSERVPSVSAAAAGQQRLGLVVAAIAIVVVATVVTSLACFHSCSGQQMPQACSSRPSACSNH